ncbi:cell surface protein [Brachyspira pulli]|uniref:cell surface protein n=1 Tax=Brachyspira pulli TaxID=310721 RepID=UPI0030064847
MKKVLLTAMALLTVASASVFGMYGNGDSWIDFLVHGNQLRARMDQLGFTLGNGTIKGTFGFRSQTSTAIIGRILEATTGNSVSDYNYTTLDATISAGIGYTSDMFGIGVGYNYTWVGKDLGIHTPVLTINALNDNLRIAVPIQIAVSDNIGNVYDQVNNRTDRTDYMGISTDIQLRYYTGIDVFNAIRFYVNYGQAGYKANNKEYFASSLGLQLRLYFLNTTVGNVNINPYLKLQYKTALEGNSWGVTSSSYYNTAIASAHEKGTKVGDYNAYQFTIEPVLGIGANSDIVSLWVEPSIGYTVSGGGMKDAGLTHKLAWGAYTELYITPVKDLEWYFEMNINNTDLDSINGHNGETTPVYFETSTGITWYLPSFGAAE